MLGKIFSAHKLKLSYFQLNSNIRIDVVLFLNDIFCGVGISELYFTLSKGCQEMSKHSRTLLGLLLNTFSLLSQKIQSTRELLNEENLLTKLMDCQGRLIPTRSVRSLSRIYLFWAFWIFKAPFRVFISTLTPSLFSVSSRAWQGFSVNNYLQHWCDRIWQGTARLWIYQHPAWVGSYSQSRTRW